MRSNRLHQWLMALTLLTLPVLAQAQEAGLSGTVSDSTGGKLPGVTVRAVHEASGNGFEAVTDARGDYRLPLRIGGYRVTAELAGFAPVTRPLTVLVGQQAVMNLQMGVSGVAESVTVTGEAPLLDTTQTSLGGNIDSRQVQELPVNGRNWMTLVMLAPGARSNGVGETPVGNEHYGVGDFQINIDGQQISHGLSPSAAEGEPRFSRDAIAEFEFITSRFDATQGRTSGVQVNAVTKSGTNTFAGSLGGYFRHDSFNAADHVAKRVLPYSDQQVSSTFGGPIRQDRLHFFANYEFEREPQTEIYTTPFPAFNIDQTHIRSEKKGGGRLDAQFSSRTRLAVRHAEFRWDRPFLALASQTRANSTPSTVWGRARITRQFLTTLTQVHSNSVVNEIKGGYSYFHVDSTFMLLKNARAPFFGSNGPEVRLRGFTAGGSRLYPQDQWEGTYSIRDDLTASFTRGGRHTLKAGGEYRHRRNVDDRPPVSSGQLDASGGPIPANITDLFPNQFDASTWNLAPLSSIAIRWTQGFGTSVVDTNRYEYAAWIQDDWVVGRLTLNLGLRYDLESNAFGNDVVYRPYFPGDQSDDTNNAGPRLGAAFTLNDRTVLRGGYGLYFGTTINNPGQKRNGADTITISIENDGRPDFATNPWNGQVPTFQQIVARECTPAAPLAPGCLRRDMPSAGVNGPNLHMPYSHQASIGLQRQVAAMMAIDVDYVYTGNRDWPASKAVNLTYDPATGANYPFRDISRRVYPWFGAANLLVNGGRANQHALQTSFTKRFGQGWQASGTYTLSVARDAFPAALQGLEPVPFPTALDMGGEYGLQVGEQRHRAVFNGIWELPYGFQLSGLYFYGSGERYNTRLGSDLRDLGFSSSGVNNEEQRLRPNGTFIPRNNFVGKPLHRVDVRVQNRFPLGGRVKIDGILELFNAFNHANFGSYTTQEANAAYGRPAQNSIVEYGPRQLQLGFRLAF